MKQRNGGMQKVVSVLLLVALLLTFATPAFAEGGPTPDKVNPIPVIPKQDSKGVVQKTVTGLPSFEDVNWPVVRIERATDIDNEGIQHRRLTIIREKPLNSKQVLPCDAVSAEAVSGRSLYWWGNVHCEFL